MPVTIAHLVEHLNEVLTDHRHVLRLLATRLGQRGRGLDDLQGQGLLSSTSLNNPEINLLTGLQGIHPCGQGRSVDVHVAAAVLRQETEPLGGVVETHLSGWHLWLTPSGHDGRWTAIPGYKP